MTRFRSSISTAESSSTPPSVLHAGLQKALQNRRVEHSVSASRGSTRSAPHTTPGVSDIDRFALLSRFRHNKRPTDGVGGHMFLNLGDNSVAVGDGEPPAGIASAVAPSVRATAAARYDGQP